MTFDLEEARRLTAEGIIDARTMIPAGLLPPPEDHPFWPNLLDRLERHQALDPVTWDMVEAALHPTHPWWDAVAPYLIDRDAARQRTATPGEVPPGRIQHGDGLG